QMPAVPDCQAIHRQRYRAPPTGLNSVQKCPFMPLLCCSLALLLHVEWAAAAMPYYSAEWRAAPHASRAPATDAGNNAPTGPDGDPAECRFCAAGLNGGKFSAVTHPVR